MKQIALKRIVINTIMVIFLVSQSILLLASCSKDNTDNEGYDIEEYEVIVSSTEEDYYSRDVRIIDLSKAQKLKWSVSFQNVNSSRYFKISPTEGQGNGSFKVRITDTNSGVYDCPIIILFTTASGKISSLSSNISFGHLQNLYSY